MKSFLIASLATLAFAPSLAKADPCTAIPDGGPPPSYLAFGRVFSGPVVHVIDGDSFCVAVGPREGDDWVEVRLADFSAPEYSSASGRTARAALERIASGRTARCVAGLGTYDRIAARCSIDGQAVGDAMLRAGVKEGGNGVEQTRRPLSARASTPERGRTSSGMSCAELRAQGGARRGEPGYRPEWDGDNDGVACEPYRR